MKRAAMGVAVLVLLLTTGTVWGQTPIALPIPTSDVVALVDRGTGGLTPRYLSDPLYI